jgi:hypothetical protein
MALPPLELPPIEERVALLPGGPFAVKSVVICRAQGVCMTRMRRGTEVVALPL